MRTLTLNIIKGYGLDPVLNVSQFDKGYTVTATVQKGAEAFTPPTGSTATVEGRKPDGTGYQYPATIDGSTVTFTVMEQMTVLSGRSMAEIVFYDADAVRIGTANFYIIVEAAPLNEETVISDTELPAIIDAANANAERAETAADEAEATLSNFAEVVAEQVEQMQIHEGQTVIDGTLTVSGAAADAKATGEMARMAVDGLGALIIDTASGAVATFTDDKGDLPIRSLVVDIEMVQSGSGDPSPTNIRPISGWDAVTTTREGTGGANRQTYTTNLPATVYGGTLDVVTGKLIVDRAMVDLGTLIWSYNASATQPFMFSSSISGTVKLPTASTQVAGLTCSMLPTVSANSIYIGESTTGIGVHLNGQVRVVYPNMPTNVNEFKTAMNGVQLCYELATPLEYTLTPQEVTTLLGSNNIYADCGDIESAEYLIDTKVYVDSQRVAIDDTLSVSGEAADAKVTGDKVAVLELRAYEGFSADESLVTISDLEDGFYSSSNGKKTDNTATSTYRRAKSLVPVKEKMLYASGNTDIRAACFTADGTYISSIYIYADESDAKRIVTPEGTALVGLYANGATSFILRKIDSSNVVGAEYPYSEPDYILKQGYWCNGNGGIYASQNFYLLIFGGITPGDRYYVSNNATANCLCFDVSGNLLTVQYEQRNSQGRIYTIPDGAVVACFNMYANRKTGVSDASVDYVVKLNGKKILAIGDSLTWLDGRQNYGGAAYVSGWQRKLRLMGFDVVNAGWSGNPYTYGINVTEGTDNSIYTKIVTNSYDVTGYDYVIMFGGTNDVLYSAPIGTRNTDYSNRTFDNATFNGAVSGIMSYIRTNNPTCKILLASFPKSEAASRVYPNASKYVEEIKYNADFWSCRYINIFDDMNVQPTYPGFSEYFYDVTHPNFNGMVVIGELMKKAVSQYE